MIRALLISRIVFCLMFSFVWAGCLGTSGRIISPNQTTSGIKWSDAEKQQEIANRLLNATDQASYHLIRLSAPEKPHVHDRHDLTVFVLSGRARVYFGDRVVSVRKGDVIEIPRGVAHWAENLSAGASEVYAVFTPPYDGKDSRTVEMIRDVRQYIK